MDWSKVDAGLAGALADDRTGRSLVVFVHLSEAVEPEALVELGVDAAGDGLVRTATLSAADVERLTDQAWVTQVRLSRLLGPLGKP